MPHSAWCAASSVSGAASPYGRIWRSMPASRVPALGRATKNPVWSVFGVQSRARRTVAGSAGGRHGEARRAERRRTWGAEAAATAMRGDRQPGDGVAGAAADRATAIRMARRRQELHAPTPCRHEKTRRRPGIPGRHRVAWACFLRWYEPDQVRRVCGLATLSAHSRSPEAVFSCRHRSTGLDQSPLVPTVAAARRRRRR